MKPALLRAVALGAAALLVTASARVTAESLQAMQKSFDKRIERFSIEDPILLLSSTQGTYLAGWGALFTAEVNLVPVAITPFRPSLSPEQIARLHDKKLQRLPVIRKMMQDMLLDSAASLDGVPAGEQVALAVNLFHFNWENTEGLPRQILMHARKGTLVEYKAGRLDAKGLADALKSETF